MDPTVDEGALGSGREWYGASPDCGPLAEDSAAKLKKGQLYVCNVFVDCVLCTPPPPTSAAISVSK
jgi:hypothetical protein